MTENIQRSNLNPIEEAKGYQRLLIKYSLTQQQVADDFGKSRQYISNKLRLLKLSSKAIQALLNGNISEGHAKILASYNEFKQII